MVLQLLFKIVVIVPFTFHGFFWYVYNFGPKHRKQSRYDILLNPVLEEEFEGWIGESDDFESLRRQRFNHNIMARCIARSKRLSIKRTTRSNTLILHDCLMSNIQSDAL